MIEFTRENIDEKWNNLWKWVIAVGPGEMFNDREWGFYILHKMLPSPRDGTYKAYWKEPFTNSVDGLAKEEYQYFNSEKEAVIHYLDRQDKRFNLKIFQLEYPWDIMEIYKQWSQLNKEKKWPVYKLENNER